MLLARGGRYVRSIMHPGHSKRRPREESASVGGWSRILDKFGNAPGQQADLLHASQQRHVLHAEPTRRNSGHAAGIRGHSTLLGTPRPARNQGAFTAPWVRCFRTRTSRLRPDRILPHRRRRLFALLRRPHADRIGLESQRAERRSERRLTSPPQAVVLVRSFTRDPLGCLLYTSPSPR